MSKEVTLTISERVGATKILNGFKGNLDQLALMLEGLKSIVVSAEEWVKAELVKAPILDAQGKPTGQENWNWVDHSPELDKAITLESEVTFYILNDLKAKEEAKEITMADVALITLKKKLL
jgi:hypothetical protein